MAATHHRIAAGVSLQAGARHSRIAPTEETIVSIAAAASTDSGTRRMVASSGGSNQPASRSRRTPRQARTCGGASATYSPTAVNDRAPASTVATAAINNDVSVCRTPRGSCGSGTPLQALQQGWDTHQPAARGHWQAGPEAAPRAGLIRENDKAGTVFRGDHGIRHPHDLGSCACSAINTPGRAPGHQPDSPPLCRGPWAETTPTTSPGIRSSCVARRNDHPNYVVDRG
jgi:hypothetical protein